MSAVMGAGTSVQNGSPGNKRQKSEVFSVGNPKSPKAPLTLENDAKVNADCDEVMEFIADSDRNHSSNHSTNHSPQGRNPSPPKRSTNSATPKQKHNNADEYNGSKSSEKSPQRHAIITGELEIEDLAEDSPRFSKKSRFDSFKAATNDVWSLKHK